MLGVAWDCGGFVADGVVLGGCGGTWQMVGKSWRTVGKSR
jgi:hypothetical protein